MEGVAFVRIAEYKLNELPRTQQYIKMILKALDDFNLQLFINYGNKTHNHITILNIPKSWETKFKSVDIVSLILVVIKFHFLKIEKNKMKW